MKLIKEILKLLVITIIMGISYMLIEILYKGNTFYEMVIIGGVAGMLVGLINKAIKWETPLYIQGTIGMIIATVCEYCGGLIFNSDYSKWDYRSLPFNIDGQICLYFMVAWFFVSLFGIWWDDFIRFKLFKEQKPHYKIF